MVWGGGGVSKSHQFFLSCVSQLQFFFFFLGVTHVSCTILRYKTLVVTVIWGCGDEWWSNSLYFDLGQENYCNFLHGCY